LASGVTASSLTSVGTLSALTVTGDLTVDTNTLKVASSTNRVGINISGAPDVTLDVDGNVDVRTGSRIATDSIINYTGGATPLTIGPNGAQSVVVQTNGTSRLVVDASGNLGVG
jgi:hypothetical protein